MFGVLLRFRTFNFGFVADIEKAFLQIVLDPSHRDFVRFLWFENFDPSKTFDDLKIDILLVCKVLFGVTSFPFLLQATIIEHIKKYVDTDSLFAAQLLASFHVDDLVSGAVTSSDFKTFFMKCKQCLARASFNLHKFQCNDSEVESDIYGVIGDDKSLVDNIKPGKNKVLGLVWDKSLNSFIFPLDAFSKKCCNALTKRESLHCIASLYDPIGLISPIVVKLKCFFQELCVAKVSCDSELSNEYVSRWLELCTPIRDVSSVIINRCYTFWTLDDPIINQQLHGFCDASQKAYGACIYLRSIQKSGKITSFLIASKSRVSPIKAQTIPRLELMVAVVLSELVNSVQIELCSRIDISSITA